MTRAPTGKIADSPDDRRRAYRNEDENLGRDDAFGQVVDPREAWASVGGGDLAGPEQVPERVLGVAPLPPAAPARSNLEIGGRERAVGGDPREHRVGFGLVICDEAPQPLVADLAALGSRYAPAQQRMQPER